MTRFNYFATIYYTQPDLWKNKKKCDTLPLISPCHPYQKKLNMKAMFRCLEEKDISPHSEAARDYIWERRNSLLLRKPQTESVRQQTGWEENFFYFFLTILKVVAKESAASDPYSIINYGLGGQIEVNIVCIALDWNVLTIPGTRWLLGQRK